MLRSRGVAAVVAVFHDTLITLGALQSNHARQTAAAAAKLGLKCVLVLEERVSQATDAYRHNGNVLLDRLLGATLKYVPRDSSMTAVTASTADEVRRAGGRPYVIPGGGSNAVGALGYVGCALEILQQAAGLGVRIDRAVHATGSSGTQAGLIAGFDGMRSGVRVLGINSNVKHSVGGGQYGKTRCAAFMAHAMILAERAARLQAEARAASAQADAGTSAAGLSS